MLLLHEINCNFNVYCYFLQYPYIDGNIHNMTNEDLEEKLPKECNFKVPNCRLQSKKFSFTSLKSPQIEARKVNDGPQMIIEKAFSKCENGNKYYCYKYQQL